jgi:hypothetical protein
VRLSKTLFLPKLYSPITITVAKADTQIRFGIAVLPIFYNSHAIEVKRLNAGSTFVFIPQRAIQEKR